jgi:hypothetical protein
MLETKDLLARDACSGRRAITEDVMLAIEFDAYVGRTGRLCRAPQLIFEIPRKQRPPWPAR